MRMKTWYLFARLLTAVAVALIRLNAYGQWAVNTGTSPPTVFTTDSTANLAIGTAAAHSYARLTLGGAEPFRFAPNPVVRLLDFDFNHLVGAAAARNGAAMRMDLRSGPPDNFDLPVFSWYIRAAGQPLPDNVETEKMYMDKSGNLVIGYQGMSGDTVNRLQVNGGARLLGNITATGSVAAGGVAVTGSITATGNITAN